MECLEQTGFVFQQLGNGYTMLKKAALAKCDFVLTEVKRQVGRWMLRYLAARENGVSPNLCWPVSARHTFERTALCLSQEFLLKSSFAV